MKSQKTNSHPYANQIRPVCLSEFFQDHRFGSDTLIDEIDTREELCSSYLEEISSPEDFNEWFREITENSHGFAKRKKAV